MLPRALVHRVDCLEVIGALIHALTACRALTNAKFDDRSFILFLFFGSQTGAKGVYTPPFLNP